MSAPNPTPIFRIVHVECLRTLLQRGGLHAANHTPDDGLPSRTIHNVDIQGQRISAISPAGRAARCTTTFRFISVISRRCCSS
jgi:hypothetical protein